MTTERVPYAVVTREGFRHGLRCSRCHRVIEVGQPYERVLDSILDDEEATPILLLVCVYCVGETQLEETL